MSSVTSPVVVRELPPNLAFLAPVKSNGLVRVGNAHDGGCVVPEEAVRGADTLLSFGVSTDWSFEQACKAMNPGLTIHAYDHTVGERHFRGALARGLVKLLLGRASMPNVRKRWRIWCSYRAFFPVSAAHFEEAIHARNKSAGHATIEKVFSRTQSQRVFLKVDIEGTEYSVLDDILRYAPRIIALVIEFHETQALRETFCAVVKRLQREFHIVHVHGNNLNHAAPDGLPNVLEITLVRGAASADAERRWSLPIDGLDSPNHAGSADHQIRWDLYESRRRESVDA